MDAGLLKGVMNDMVRMARRYREEGRYSDAQRMTAVITNLTIAVDKSDMHIDTESVRRELEDENAGD